MLKYSRKLYDFVAVFNAFEAKEPLDMSSQLPRDEGGGGGGDLLAENVFCPQCRRKYGGGGGGSTPEGSGREAKLLNCLDTFCIDCLRKRVHDVTANYPWQAVSCQLCQTPIDAVGGGGGEGGGIEVAVRTNPVVERLLKIEAITSDPNAGERHSPCDACAAESSENSDGKTTDQNDGDLPHAEVYCEECDQRLCSACHAAHGKLRQTKSHKPVVRLGSPESKALARSWKDVLPPCASHDAASGEFYCGTCSEYACGTCAKEHVGRHKSPSSCRPSAHVVQELRTGLTRQAEEIAKLGRESKAKQEAIKHRRKLFADSVVAASGEIRRRAQVMRRTIDQHEDELTAELERIRVKTEEEFDEELDSAKRNELRMNRFVKFTGLAVTVDLSTLEELRPMVNQRAAELKGTRSPDSVQFAFACLAPGVWEQTVTVSGGNSIGSLEVKRSSQA